MRLTFKRGNLVRTDTFRVELVTNAGYGMIHRVKTLYHTYASIIYFYLIGGDAHRNSYLSVASGACGRVDVE
jgi:hypothetical protein